VSNALNSDDHAADEDYTVEEVTDALRHRSPPGARIAGVSV
jgi:hypothetical protein